MTSADNAVDSQDIGGLTPATHATAALGRSLKPSTGFARCARAQQCAEDEKNSGDPIREASHWRDREGYLPVMSFAVSLVFSVLVVPEVLAFFAFFCTFAAPSWAP